MNKKSHPSSNTLCLTNLFAFGRIYPHTFELHEHILFVFMCELVAYVICYVYLWMPHCAMNCEFYPLFIEVMMVYDRLANLFLNIK